MGAVIDPSSGAGSHLATGNIRRSTFAKVIARRSGILRRFRRHAFGHHSTRAEDAAADTATTSTDKQRGFPLSESKPRHLELHPYVAQAQAEHTPKNYTAQLVDPPRRKVQSTRRTADAAILRYSEVSTSITLE